MRKTDPLARYTLNHEWARMDGSHFTIGITDFGQAVMKDITLALLPEVGRTFKKGDVFCILESSKAANEVEMPLSGSVTAINVQLQIDPSQINSDCYGEGWLAKVSVAGTAEWDGLMDAEGYWEEVGVFFRKG